MAVTIVTYHYVRDLAHSRYPGIKGCTIETFDRQLEYLLNHYQFVRLNDLIASRDGVADLPQNAAVLTFDDGYIDHYTVVFPRLLACDIQGWFFPVVAAARNRQVLTVNKIQFILASAPDVERLADEVLDLARSSGDPRVETADIYRLRLATPGKWDPPEVMLVKRLLQQELPRDVRDAIVHEIFRRYVTVDDFAFANELYADEPQLRTMAACGMYVGSHSVSHSWMDHLTGTAQADEVDRALAFLGDIGAPTEDWVFCYPYGRYDESLMHTLSSRKCAFGLLTKPGVASLGRDAPLLLPRVDTNDIPTS